MERAAKKLSGSILSCLIAASLVFHSCATYKAKTADVEVNLFDGDFKAAVANIDQNKFLLKDRNRLLFLMEKGKVEHLNGNYSKSNELFEQAYIMLDDKVKSNVGQTLAAKFTNPMAEPYKGEDFEKVTIHYYMALNYFQLGKPDEALVEAKRINIKLNALNEKYKENKNKYAEDAFSQILQGLLYEGVGDINNAFIAYRNAADLYFKNNDQFFGVPLPEQLKKDLLRTSRQLGFDEEYAFYAKKFNITPVSASKNTAAAKKPVTKKPSASSSKSKAVKSSSKSKAPVSLAEKPKTPVSEAVIFWENGLGPFKGQTKITAAGSEGTTIGSYADEQNDIIIPVPAGVNIGLNAIAIPKYLERESYYKRASIVVDGKEQPFELSQNFYTIAKQCLKDRMMREAIDIALRFAAKKSASKGLSMLANNYLGSTASSVTSFAADAANVATEKADTRNWQTLPATISYTRVPLYEGENTFAIKRYGDAGVDVDTIRIKGGRGLQIVNYFDLGRTTGKILEATPATTATPAIAASDKSPTGSTAAALTSSAASNSSSTAAGTLKEIPADIIYQSKTAVENEWVEAGNGLAYKVVYTPLTGKKYKNMFKQEIFFTNKSNESLTCKYSVTPIHILAPVDNTYKGVDIKSLPELFGTSNKPKGFAALMALNSSTTNVSKIQEISKTMSDGKHFYFDTVELGLNEEKSVVNPMVASKDYTFTLLK